MADELQIAEDTVRGRAHASNVLLRLRNGADDDGKMEKIAVIEASTGGLINASLVSIRGLFIRVLSSFADDHHSPL